MKNLKVVYPYNEILPKKKAHDLYIVHSCAALSQQGLDTTLLCGKGSQISSGHYPMASHVHFQCLPIVRKNNFLNLSWNRPFFSKTQAWIEACQPDVVLLSVPKQAAYHLKRRVPGVRYLYEVHQLRSLEGEPVEEERAMLRTCDHITVTTEALAKVLRSEPYALDVPITVIPLAVHAEPLPPPTDGPFTLAYVGQDYPGQGVDLLLRAAGDCPLKILGASRPDSRFLGFVPPAQIPEKLTDVHAFVAPFEAVGRMPYVAHTKLHEYAAWGRPIIAPDMPVVREHFVPGRGVVLFEPGSVDALKAAIAYTQTHLPRLQQEILTLRDTFSWQQRAKRLIPILENHITN